MRKIFFILFIAVIASGAVFYFSKTKKTEKLIGGDKDEHGCLIAAGYSWCEVKQKCLRIWEEPCEAVTSAPTIDETEALKTAIKKALVAKHGSSANELKISVSKVVGGYAQGGASGEGGGGMWFGAKVNGQWQLVWDGNGVITCESFGSYPDFPKEMVPECYDEQSGKMKKR
ncbi:MAG: hypothetical protein BWY24_00346 [Microgenomates group bacterium ADurb.Bin219]|nr:MAG: hypothetical protein BWY24_00346 [Microgenomates group bacterium ADurb.Bin219]